MSKESNTMVMAVIMVACIALLFLLPDQADACGIRCWLNEGY